MSEIAKFDALAAEWWDPRGPMRPLHAMNPVRVAWIAARAGQPGRLLDVGCGAGLAAEALTRLGFTVSGVDAAPATVAAARAHAAAAGLTIDYRVGELADAGSGYAAVTALEVIEHVPDQPAFMAGLAAAAAPGARVFVSTLNRTVRSLAVAKVGAEYIARLLPVGTHDWRRFVRPEELAAWSRAAGLRLVAMAGLEMGVRGWRVGRDLGVNYIAAFERG